MTELAIAVSTRLDASPLVIGLRPSQLSIETQVRRHVAAVLHQEFAKSDGFAISVRDHLDRAQHELGGDALAAVGSLPRARPQTDRSFENDLDALDDVLGDDSPSVVNRILLRSTRGDADEPRDLDDDDY